jgi:hypothetical protein
MSINLEMIGQKLVIFLRFFVLAYKCKKVRLKF